MCLTKSFADIKESIQYITEHTLNVALQQAIEIAIFSSHNFGLASLQKVGAHLDPRLAAAAAAGAESPGILWPAPEADHWNPALLPSFEQGTSCYFLGHLSGSVSE